MAESHANVNRTLKGATLLAVGLGRVCVMLAAMRALIFAFFLLSTSVCMFDREESQEQSISKLHDLTGLIAFAFFEICFVLYKDRAASIMEVLTERIECDQTNAKSCELFMGYVNNLRTCIFVVKVMKYVAVLWAVSNFYLLYYPVAVRNQTCVHLVVGWFWQSDYYLFFFSMNILCSLVCIMTIFQWTLLVLAIVMKMKYKIGAIRADLRALNQILKFADLATHSSSKSTILDLETGDDMDVGKDIVGTSSLNTNKGARITERECEAKIYNYLKSIVDQHYEVIKCVKLTDKTFCWFFWANAQFGGLAAALILPKVNLDEHLSPQAIAKVIESLNILLVTGVFNVFGQMLLNESESLRESLYSCEWPDKPRSLRQGLLIMQIVASRRLKLTMGGIYTLGMEAYKNILHAIYSYTTLIQGLK